MKVHLFATLFFIACTKAEEYEAPVVQILSPAANAAIPNPVSVSLLVEELELVASEARQTRSASPLWWIPSAEAHGAGHAEGRIHIYLDGEEYATDEPTQFVLPDLSVGEHELKAEAVDLDGQAFDPPAADQVNFSIIED